MRGYRDFRGETEPTWEMLQKVKLVGPQGLESDDFYRLIKFVMKGELTEEVEGEITARLGNGKLGVREVCTIFLEGPENNSQAWRRVREGFLERIKECPSDATLVLEMAIKIFGWQLPAYETNESGPGYVSTSRLSVKGQDYVSEPQIASRKKESMHRANVSLLGKIVDIDVTFEDSGKGMGDERSLWRNNNYKRRLVEKCQKMQWEMPQYVVERSGPDHMPEFSVTARLEAEGRTYESESCVGSTKREAGQLASKSLLEKLPFEQD